jgi:hypothetical protein
MDQDPSGPGGLRIGHRERDAVAEVLKEAAGDGRLSLDELDERLEAALQARTYADLDPLVADLAVELPSRQLGTGTGTGSQLQPQRPPVMGYSREDPLRLDAGMSSEKRQGAWTIPPFVRISPGMGSVKLDCLDATPAAAVIEVEVTAGAGSILIVLPDGWAADVDRLTNSWGSKAVKVARDPEPGKPLLVFYGAVGLGSFKVRPPSRRDLRRAARRRRALAR